MEGMMFERFWKSYLGEGKPEGKDFVSKCRECGGGRFSADMVSGRFHCWSCRKIGNYVTYLKMIHPQWTREDIQDEMGDRWGIHREMIPRRVRKAFECPMEEIVKNEARLSPEALEGLSKERGISPGIFKKHRLGMNQAGEIVFPIFDESGRVVDLRRRSRRFQGERASKGVQVGIFGIIHAESHPMILCESPMDAMASEEMGFPALAMCGAGQKIGRHLGVFRDKCVILAFDNDDAGKEGMRRVSDELKGVVKSVAIFEIPQKEGIKDINDMLIKGRRGEFAASMTALIAEIAASGAPSNTASVENGAPSDFSRADAEKTEQKPANIEISGAKSGGLICAPVEIVKDLPVNPTAYDAAQFFISGYIRGRSLTLRYWRGDFYEFTGTGYKVIPEDVVKSRVNSFLAQFEETRPWAGARLGTHVIENLRSLTILDPGTPAPMWCGGIQKGRYLSFINGLLDLSGITSGKKGGELLEHTPDYFDLNPLDYAFDLGAECPRFMRFLDEVLPDQKTQGVIQEYMGYCLDSSLKLEKMLLLKGRGSNGKSRIAEVIQHLVGSGNTSTVGIHQLGEHFALASTLHKKVNLMGDMEDVERAAEGLLKMWITREPMQFERKYKEPFMAEPTAVIVGCSNHMPRFRDRSDGIWRRLLIIPFERQFMEGDQDIELGAKLRRELPGIFNWAVLGLVRLYAQKRFSISEEIQKAVGGERMEQNTALMYLREHYEEAPLGEEVEIKGVYAGYRAYCEESGYKPLGLAQFGQDLKAFFPKVAVTQKRVGSSRPRMYAGLRALG